METVAKRMYEAMFLVDPTYAASDWEGVNEGIKKILEKFDAEIVSMRKWDNRNLAYEINKQSRGTYILCYFKGDGTKNREIERDVQLSEHIMRVLILNAEAMTQEDIDKDTPVIAAEKRSAKAVEDAKKRAEEAQAKAEAEPEPEAEVVEDPAEETESEPESVEEDVVEEDVVEEEAVEEEAKEQ
ncbi:30S ribosomal protein S6 [Planctomycetota bacterium]